MIQKRIEEIEAKIEAARNIPESARTEILNLLSGLKSDVATLAATHDEDAQSIASFVDVTAHEATREQKKPELMNAALSGLTSSVEGLEASHPGVVQTVNRLATILSNMGI